MSRQSAVSVPKVNPLDDIDRAGGLLHVRQGKRAKDRKVILPPLTLEMLGRYWKLHRNPGWLFPALGRDGKGRS